jgi:hypothetical protein
MGSTVEQFFEAIERESKEGKTLPVWYVFLIPFVPFYSLWKAWRIISRGILPSSTRCRNSSYPLISSTVVHILPTVSEDLE